MATHAVFNTALAAVFSNGRGEVGLEVGADPGLPADQYVQVPRCMIKAWAARVNPYDSVYIARHPAVEQTDRGPRAIVEAWDSSLGVAHYAGRPGWVTSGDLYFHDSGLKAPASAWNTTGTVLVGEFHMDPHTFGDIEAFVTVNAGHVRDADFSEATLNWIHATRFWATASGFVRTSKSTEYTIVDNPTNIQAGATQTAEFVYNYAANAWTASAARATSWRKSNHATGGDIAAGFPRRWLQKMGYMVQNPDRAEQARGFKLATSAFYVATHASSPHAVLALMAPEDTDHWVLLNPSFGLITSWDVNESARIRMTPKTQVAGVAMVTDSVVTIKMLIAEGLAPLLTNLDQAQALADAYNTVDTNGIKVAIYANWFLEGHPSGASKVDFSQKNSSFSALVGELAIVATKYYAGTTIAGSAALQNAAQQLGEDSARTIWSALGRQKSSLSAQQIVRAYARIKGASSASAVMGILSSEDQEVETAVADYNQNNSNLATQFNITATVSVDLATIKANAAAADRIAATLLGSTS